jgi:predicted anti-sigma-YlaC factor YlaD
MELVPLLCERARRWASLRTDGELSELESALLDNHLGRCRSCRAFARGIEDVAAALGAARVERPAPLALALPGRRRNAARLQYAAASTLIVAAAAVAVLLGGIAGHGSATRATKQVSMVHAGDTPNELRTLRRAVLIAQVHPVLRNRQDPNESY